MADLVRLLNSYKTARDYLGLPMVGMAHMRRLKEGHLQKVCNENVV